MFQSRRFCFNWLLSFLFDGALSNFVDDGRRVSSFLRFGVDMWLAFFFFGLCSQSILDFRLFHILALQFQRRRFLEIDQSKTRIAYGSHVC
jgi:hypothetical protein